MDMYSIVSNVNVEYVMNTRVITSTRTLVVGGHVRLNPSCAYCGIMSGVVIIDAVIEPEEEDSERDLARESDISTVGSMNDPDANAMVRYYQSCQYIKYYYAHGEEEGIQYMDIDTFLAHSSQF